MTDQIEIDDEIKNFLELEGIDLETFLNEELHRYVNAIQEIGPLKDQINELEQEVNDLESELDEKKTKLRRLRRSKRRKSQMCKEIGAFGQVDLDIDVVESGNQRQKLRGVREIIDVVAKSHESGKAPVDEVIDVAVGNGFDFDVVEDEIDSLKRSGEVIEPEMGYLRLV